MDTKVLGSILLGIILGVAQAQKTPTTDFTCPEEFGYFPHPSDCSQYYVCVFGGALLESCTGGLMYSNELQTCDWPRNVNQCNNGTLETLHSVQVPVKRHRSTTERSAYNAYKPIKIESLGDLREAINSQDNQEEFLQSNRAGRSYAQDVPDYKHYGKEVPHGRARRSLTLLNYLMDKIGLKKVQDYKQSRSHGPSPGSMYPSSHYPTFGSITHPSDLRTTNRPNFNNYFTQRPAVMVTFRSKSEGTFLHKGPYTRPYIDKHRPFDSRLKGGNQFSSQFKGESQSSDSNYDYYDAHTTLKTTRKPFLDIQNGDYNRSVSSPKYAHQQQQTYQEYVPQEEYSNQRYAAHVPVNNTPTYSYPEANEDDSAYYVYEDEEDYKPTYKTPTTTYKTTTTQKPKRKPTPANRRPTLKPKSSIVPKEQAAVRDVYLDAPSRPLPFYATPTPNTPATKCRKDTCLLPDCYCGGKEIPSGLKAEQVPQMVLLTFDDSVNDLNKNLYKDLFEKGRKNPNGCPISATFYVSHEWTDYSQVQNLAADGHEIASHSVSHSFGESFSQKKWEKEMNGQREILSAYGGVKLSSVRGMRAPFLAIGGNNMFKMLHEANFTYDSSMPVYENRPPSWPYTLDYKIFHDCMIPPCPTKSYPGVWEVPMVMWTDLKGGRCSMGDACSNPPTAEGVYQMLAKNFERHYTTNRAPFGLYYHAAWFTQAHHKEGFEAFLDTLVSMDDVWLVTNYQALEWVRNPTPNNQINSFAPWNQCHHDQDRPKRCNHPRVCNLWHKSGVRYMKTCQTCPQQYPWTGNTGVPYTI